MGALMNNNKPEFKPHTLAIRKEFLEKIQAKAYWDRISQKDLLDKILKQYFKGKQIKLISGGKK
jgi:hypothetical protein